jgi:hypothetical protein
MRKAFDWKRSRISVLEVEDEFTVIVLLIRATNGSVTFGEQGI